jgi:hypothetical protein
MSRNSELFAESDKFSYLLCELMTDIVKMFFGLSCAYCFHIFFHTAVDRL